jgi:hypothetical protein
MDEFTCVCCGDDTEVRFLSRGSLEKAGTLTRRQALEVLPEIDQVCQFCEDDQTDDVEDPLGFFGTCTLDGLYLSDATPLERYQSLI